ncbi:MAG TPA: tRNA epoxyqueuosine(34) reductase QueG [Kiritimatiellia bacterium]|nr:tRNA epoxyqueuosine(34) reductase QueG [Kiritimatiellia bacterium]
MAVDSTRIKARALELGFDVAGVARAGPAPRAERFRDWLAAGRHADMAWLAKEPERRSDTTRAVPGAKSVISVGLAYFIADPPAAVWDDPLRGRIARYAWGRDYHDELLPRMRELAAWIEAETGRPIVNRAYVDTGPVLEREWAAQAGLGFIGKNTLVIHPEWGSYLFLGELLLDLELEPDAPVDERVGTCGSCRRCQDICPTHAFPAPYILDSRLCLSYLTIEHRGAIPEALRSKMKNWIYGCDECQSVCPWVKQFSKPGRTRFLNYDPDFAAPRLTDLLALDDAGFRERFRKTPIPRTKRRGLLRNVCVALGNSARPEVIPALECAARDPEPLIAEHAQWAIDRLRDGG